MEVDHLDGGNSNKSFSDVDSFIKSIMFVTPDDIQVLCKDKHKVVNKKKVFVSFGCHSIKTLMQKQGCSFEEARVRKQHILIDKEKRVLEELRQRGVLVPPKTKVAQNALLLELMLKEINSEGKV